MNKALYDWLDKIEGKKYSTYKRICKEKENFDNEYYESFEWFWDKKKEEQKKFLNKLKTREKKK